MNFFISKPRGLVLALFFLTLPLLAQAHVSAQDPLNQAPTVQRLNHYSRDLASYQTPAVTLVDQHGIAGNLVTSLNNQGPLLLQFIFTTCPTVCPVLCGTFAAAQQKLEPGFARWISVTIDPEHDTPARLADYAKKFNANDQWRFLTGSREDIVRVQKAFDVYFGNKMRHEPITFMRGGNKGPWLRLTGFMSAAELVAECRRLTP